MIFTAEAPPRATQGTDDLLAGSLAGWQATSAAMTTALTAAAAAYRGNGPLPPGRPAEVLAAATRELGPGIPADGLGTTTALQRLATILVEHGLDLSHPMTAAHLQPPTLAVAVAADAVASAGNASLDTFDSGPSAIAVERWLVRALTGLAGLGPRADGVLTPGGSLSNLLGLLLARDAAAAQRGIDARRDGIHGLPAPVVFCSEVAHFSVHRACAALGLGENAVVTVAVDDDHRMRPDALDAAINAANDAGRTIVAVVATAGNTDFGSVDPLPELADVTAAHGLWLHVDAAYGFGTLFSDRLRSKLSGIELADSITLDLHKIGWQPAPASVLMVSDTSAFTALDREVAYLNPADDADAGYDGLLGRSLQTTRRPDAVKVAATLLALGRRGLGSLVEACHDLARHAEHRVSAEPELELVSPAHLTTVVFRHRGGPDGREVNGELRRRLLQSGAALIGRTEVHGRPALKFTLLNPTSTPADIDRLVDLVLEAGRDCLADA